jgi:regulator of replication initiation timing
MRDDFSDYDIETMSKEDILEVIDELDGDIDEVDGEISDLEVQLIELEREKQALRAKIAELRQELDARADAAYEEAMRP